VTTKHKKDSLLQACKDFCSPEISGLRDLKEDDEMLFNAHVCGSEARTLSVRGMEESNTQ
jgi:hypothetical protein